MSNLLITLFAIPAILSVYGCASMQSRWVEASSKNTIESFEESLKRYSEGSYSNQARDMLKKLYEQKDWKTALNMNTSDAYQEFINKYPYS